MLGSILNHNTGYSDRGFRSFPLSLQVSAGIVYQLDHDRILPKFFFIIIPIVGSEVQLDPLGTATTNRPIVLTSSNYDGEIGGMMIVRGRRSIRRKPAPVPICPPQTPHALPEILPNFFHFIVLIIIIYMELGIFTTF
jgi:hypothetical protein